MEYWSHGGPKTSGLDHLSMENWSPGPIFSGTNFPVTVQLNIAIILMLVNLIQKLHAIHDFSFSISNSLPSLCILNANIFVYYCWSSIKD